MIPSFFFDTADTGAISKVYSRLTALYGHFINYSIIGVTTNPNAMAKIGATSLSDMVQVILDIDRFFCISNDELSSFYTRIPQEIHIQLPDCDMPFDDCLKWFEYFEQLELQSKLVFKMPPNAKLLSEASRHSSEKKIRYYNVTGLADAASILWALSYPYVSYASIIPGRMQNVMPLEEVNKHLQLLASAKIPVSKKIIAGSMRTLDGLKDAINYNTVPTIGTRVWDLMTGDDFKHFASWWSYNSQLIHSYVQIDISDANRNLSNSFFEEMNKLGEPIANEFKQLIHGKESK